MSKARLVITAVTVEKRPVSEVARSRWPKTSPNAIAPEAAALIARPRKELASPIPAPTDVTRLHLHRRDRLGSILHEYRHAA